MDYEMRVLKDQKELKRLIDLEMEVWGFSEADSDSILTMKVISNPDMRLGYSFGAYSENEMVGGCVFFASLDAGKVYGHLVCFKEEFRNRNMGTLFIRDCFRHMMKEGVRKAFWTYEPLDAGNSSVYINKLGGAAVKYIPDYIEIEDRINGGVPLDRMICEVDLSEADSRSGGKIDFSDAVENFPIITEHTEIEEEFMLLEIPGDYKKLKSMSLENAVKFRMESRRKFMEWINERGFIGEKIVTGFENDLRRNFYLLHKSFQ